MKTKFLFFAWFAALFGSANLMVPAQTTISGGSYVIVASGTTMTNLQDIKVLNGGNLTVNGALTLKKNLVNQNSSQYNLGPGGVEFSGSVAQGVTGLNIIQNLVLNNSEGLSVGGNTRVNGILTFTDGRITLGSFNLLLGPSASVAGTTSYKKMIVATGSGELRKEFSGTGSFTYPVGDADGTVEYSPVTLTFTSGVFSAGNYAGVNLVNTKYPDPGITGNYLNRYWNISQSGIGSFSCNAGFQYLTADITGSENLLSCTKVNPLPWNTFSPANTTLHQLSASGITGFSSFTGLKSTTAPQNQQLTNINILNGMSRCYDATQVLTVAGNGSTFIVSSGGSATLVAGAKISMLPGTRVFSGGYLHGFISTNGLFCGSAMNPLVNSNSNGEEIMTSETRLKDFSILVYPNPTTDQFIVEYHGPGITKLITIDLYDMKGRQIDTRATAAVTKNQFSLSGLPPGIYMIHISTENHSEIAKIVKY